MKRWAIALLGIACAVTVVIAAAGSGGTSGATYWVELDNAFGLVPGSDVKVAGVRAGRIGTMDIDRRTLRARIQIRITRSGFGGLRRDVFCETRPQSLIGEYFLDCEPGRARRALPPGARIPVSQTGSTIPPDLVYNVLRLPYRQRLRVVLNELGAGLAGRGGDLNATIRRAVPALRELDRVLAILGDQRATIADLTTRADTVLSALADNRSDVARWVVATRGAASAAAARRGALARSLHDLPPFLEQLRPAMRSLGQVADAQTPALENLSASAPQLTRLLRDVQPFADASRPALHGLGQVADAGRKAVPPASASVALLRRFTQPTPELARNLRIVLRDLDDRRRATERDPRSPGGRGFSGLEALLQYVFNQSLAINPFDDHGYVLRASVFTSDCAPYTEAERFKRNAAKLAHCRSWLGPSQPGITTPDPTAGFKGGPQASAARAGARGRHGRSARGPAAAGGAPAPAGSLPPAGVPGRLPPVLPGGPGTGTVQALLDYLLGP